MYSDHEKTGRCLASASGSLTNNTRMVRDELQTAVAVDFGFVLDATEEVCVFFSRVPSAWASAMDSVSIGSREGRCLGLREESLHRDSVCIWQECLAERDR